MRTSARPVRVPSAPEADHKVNGSWGVTRWNGICQLLIGGPFLAETLVFFAGRRPQHEYFYKIQAIPLLLSNEEAEVDAVSASYAPLCPAFRPRPRQRQWHVGEPRVVQAASKGANFSSTSYEHRELLFAAKSQ
jgi:hypothetical protein